jgi:hypothetical protein
MKYPSVDDARCFARGRVFECVAKLTFQATTFSPSSIHVISMGRAPFIASLIATFATGSLPPVSVCILFIIGMALGAVGY